MHPRLDAAHWVMRLVKHLLGRWPRGGLTLVAPCGLLALRLRRNGPVCGCDGGVEMSGVGTAVLASRRG
ncbi:hypothetical protein ACOMHN_009907 [Nucella lapillus]